MFYILIIPLMLLQVYVVVRLYQIKKHDRVLFRYCNLRRKIMTYMRQEGDYLSTEDYSQLRMILGMTNDAIANFNDHKVNLFNLRKVNKVHLEAKHEIEASERILSQIENLRIKEFYKGFALATFRAVLSFTPYLKSQLALGLIKVLLKLLISAGSEKARFISKVVNWVDNQNEHYSHNGIRVA